MNVTRWLKGENLTYNTLWSEEGKPQNDMNDVIACVKHTKHMRHMCTCIYTQNGFMMAVEKDCYIILFIMALWGKIQGIC